MGAAAARQSTWIALNGAGSFATVLVPIDFIRLPLIAVVGAAIIFAGTYHSLSYGTRR